MSIYSELKWDRADSNKCVKHREIYKSNENKRGRSELCLPILKVELCDIFTCSKSNCYEFHSTLESFNKVRKKNFTVKLSDVFSHSELKCESADPNKFVKQRGKCKSTKNMKSSPEFCLPTVKVQLYDILKSSKRNGNEFNENVNFEHSNEKLDCSSFSKKEKTMYYKEDTKSGKNTAYSAKKSCCSKCTHKEDHNDNNNSKEESSIESEDSSEEENSSKNETDSDWERSSGTESYEDDANYWLTCSRKVEIKKRREVQKRKKRQKRILRNKAETESESNSDSDDREVSEFAKLAQKNREEKMAFLKSLCFDEIKEDIKAAVKTKKEAKRKNYINQKECVPARKSSRISKLERVNLCEEFIFKTAYSEALEESEKQQGKERFLKIKRKRKPSEVSESDENEEFIGVRKSRRLAKKQLQMKSLENDPLKSQEEKDATNSPENESLKYLEGEEANNSPENDLLKSLEGKEATNSPENDPLKSLEEKGATNNNSKEESSCEREDSSEEENSSRSKIIPEEDISMI